MTSSDQGSKAEDTGGETWGAPLKIGGGGRGTALKRGSGPGQGPEPEYSGRVWGAGRPASWELDGEAQQGQLLQDLMVRTTSRTF